MKQSEMETRRQQALGYFERAGIVLTDAEKAAVEVTDYDLGRFEEIGLFLLTYFNTGRSSARELVLLPGQAWLLRIRQHKHLAGYDGSRGGVYCQPS